MRDERQGRGDGEQAPRDQDRRRANGRRRARRSEDEPGRVRGEERRKQGPGRRERRERRTRMPLEEPPAREGVHRTPLRRGRGHEPGQSFKCGHCKRFIGPLPSGGHHRNHCPFCLYSRHVDDHRSGDRASACGALMAPIGAFQRPNGEHVVVHACLGCGFERFNRIAADDNFDLVLALPVVPPRSARPPEMP